MKTSPPKTLHNTALNNANPAITLVAGVEKYLQDLRCRHYRNNTVYGYQQRLQFFVDWAEERALTLAASITEAHLRRYQQYLHQYRYCQKQQGKPQEKRLQASTQKGYLTVIKQLFSWLAEHRWLSHDPALTLNLPKVPYRLSHRLLTGEQITQLLAVIDLDSPTGLRDRSIIETLYSTGLRRSELIHLDIGDIDMAEGMVWVRQGKGNKDRRVPIGERAIQWVERYLEEWRSQRPRANQCQVLYLSEKGYPLRIGDVGQKIRDYKQQANIQQPGGCHLFRHAMATHMLDNGADIRHVQEMLGHVSLSSTQIYTQVSKQALKKVHSKTHPLAENEVEIE
jgi:integrase/recombinase XerD